MPTLCIFLSSVSVSVHIRLNNFAQNLVSHMQLGLFNWGSRNRALEASEILEISFQDKCTCHLPKNISQICSIFKVIHKIHSLKDEVALICKYDVWYIDKLIVLTF